MFRVLTQTSYAAVINFDYPKVAALVASEVGKSTHEYMSMAL